VVRCQLPLEIAEEIAFENGTISNFQGLVTLTLDLIILHTVVHHSLTSTYMPSFIEIKETLWTYGRTFDIQETKQDNKRQSLSFHNKKHTGGFQAEQVEIPQQVVMHR